MHRARFVTLVAVVSAVTAAAVLAGVAAARSGDSPLEIVAVLAAAVALLGMVILGRVVVVVERARRRR